MLGHAGWLRKPRYLASLLGLPKRFTTCLSHGSQFTVTKGMDLAGTASMTVFQGAFVAHGALLIWTLCQGLKDRS